MQPHICMGYNIYRAFSFLYLISVSLVRLKEQILLDQISQKRYLRLESPTDLTGFKLPLSQGEGIKESACQCRRWKRCRFSLWVGKIPWRRTRQPTPVFLPGVSHGQSSLVGYSQWDHKESDMTEQLSIQHS